MTTKNEFRTYEYRPPNVEAIRWDGTQETAEVILKTIPVTCEVSARVNMTSRSESPKVSLFLGPDKYAVQIGDYLVIEPADPQGNRPVHLTSAAEFEYSYKPQHPDGPVPHTLEGEDYEEPAYSAGGEVYGEAVLSEWARRPAQTLAIDLTDDQLKNLIGSPPADVSWVKLESVATVPSNFS